MPKVYSEAESVRAIAGGLVANYHPELATARIRYIFVDKASARGGIDVLGKTRKVSGPLEYLLELDFLIEVAGDKWVELDNERRTALVDHLLERCTGEEDEKSAEMVWKIREPDVQEFASILRRHGAWNDQLSGFVSVAQEIEVDTIAREETMVDTAEVQTESVEDLLSEL
jgi:hypothetical protein